MVVDVIDVDRISILEPDAGSPIETRVAEDSAIAISVLAVAGQDARWGTSVTSRPRVDSAALTMCGALSPATSYILTGLS